MNVLSRDSSPCLFACEGEEDFIKTWSKFTKGRHRNVCFDVHCYHCASSATTTLPVRTAAEDSKVSRTSSMARLLRSSFEPWRCVASSQMQREYSGGSNFASLSGGQHRDVQAASHGCRPGRRKGTKARKLLGILPCSMRSCPRGEWSLGLGQATWCTCGDLDEAGCFGVSFGTISCSCGFVLPNVEWHGRLNIGASSAEC